MAMAKIHWAFQVDGSFQTGADWVGQTVPGPSDDAILDAAGSTDYTVTSSANQTVNSIQTASTATLAISDSDFTATAGDGGGVNAGAIDVDNNSNFTVGGAVDNTGSILLASVGNLTDLIIGANTTLTGGGAIVLTDNGANRLYGAAASDTLTNVDNIISGSGQLGIGQLTLINEASGIIAATGSTNVLTINLGASTLTNDGAVEGVGAAGLILQDTTVDDSGGGIIFAEPGSTVSLQTADIIGGTLEDFAGGAIQTIDGGSKLDGTGTHPVTIVGVLDLPNNTELTIDGRIDLPSASKGEIELESGGNATVLIVGASGAAIVGGEALLGDNANNDIDGTVTSTNAGAFVSSLTNEADISGAGDIGVNLELTNDDVIDATGANALVIATGGGGVAGSNIVHNNDVLEATNPGALSATGGLRLANVVIANHAGEGILEANGANTHVDLQSATIEGGTLETLHGGVIQTVDGGSVLDGVDAVVANEGLLNLLNNTGLTLDGTIDNTGAVSLNSTGNLTDLIIGASNATLEGGGDVTLDDNGANRIYGAAAADTLTNIDNTISGGGQLGVGQLTLVNDLDGIIDATGTNNPLVLSVGSPAVTNDGLLEATGAAGLTIQNSTIDGLGGGEILANGAPVDLESADLIGGELRTAGAGVIQTIDGGSVLDGTTMAVVNEGQLELPNNTSLTIEGAIDNESLISLESGGNLTNLIVGAGGATLDGDGEIVLSDNGANRIYGAASTDTLTNLDNTISGAGQLGVNQLTLINDTLGVIDATGASNQLFLQTSGDSITNDGLIEATGAAGLTIQSTSLSDSSGGELLVGNGSQASLQSADIVGGVIQTNGSGVVETIDGGSELDGTGTHPVTLAGLVDLLNNTGLTLDGRIDNTDQIDLNSVGNLTDLIVGASNAILSGGGQIILSDNGANRLYGASASDSLTNVDNTISGAGQLGVGQLTLVNDADGVIDATGTSNQLFLYTGGETITNDGLVETTGAAGLTVQFTTLNDSNGGSLVVWTGSQVSLQSADIVGGVIQTEGSGFVQTIDGGSELDGTGAHPVTLAAVVELLNNTALTLDGTIDNTKQIDVDSGGNLTNLVVGASNVTLTGGGRIVLADNGASRLYGASASDSLTNVDNTISGAGQLGVGQLTLVNDASGVIDATGVANALVLYTGGETAINHGLIEATGAGGLTVYSSTLNDSGGGNLVVGAGSHIDLQSADIVGGVLESTGSGLFQTVDGGTLFDGVTSTVRNEGLVEVLNNTQLTLDGAIDNSGRITLASGGNLTNLLIAADGATLTGGGQVTLSDNGANRLYGASATYALINVNNTISGAGQLGVGQLTLDNEAGGVIDATGVNNALVIDTGGETILNAGLVKVTGAAGASIQSAIDNTGVLEVDGGALVVSGAVSGDGSTLVVAGKADFTASFGGDVTFNALSGTLQLAQSQGYTGAITGFATHGTGGSDTLDLDDIAFVRPTEATFAGNSSGGILTVTDGTHTAHISLVGDYTLSTFVAASDGSGGTDVTVNKTTPVARPDSYSTTLNHTLTVDAALGVLANDVDTNGLTLTAILATAPTHGTLTLNASGAFVYKPDSGFSGTDSFTYIARDAAASAAPTTVTIHVVGGSVVTNPETYGDNAGQVLAATAATGVLANDSDANNLPLTAALAPGGGPTHGKLVLNANGSFTYTPNLGFAGKDSFTYIASDSLASSAPTTVTIDVTARAPTGVAETYADDAGHGLTTTAASGVLIHDTDPNGLTLTAALAPGGGPKHGTLVLNANGAFTYTPTLGFAGVDTFTYIARDSLSSSAPTTVTIDVTAHAPASAAETYADNAGHGLTTTTASGVLIHDTDPNGLTLTAALAPGGGPKHGTLVLSANGSFTYTPNLGFAGADTFTYIARDSLASSAPTTVTIDVTAHAPTSAAESYADNAGQGLATTTATGVLVHDTDLNGLTLTAALAPGGGPAHGKLVLNANGSFTYTPNLGFAGKDAFTYIASDSLSKGSPTTVTIDVTARAPISRADDYSDQGGEKLSAAATSGVLANDTDLNGLTLTATLAEGGGPKHGTLVLNANGAFTYTPNLGFAGKDDFTYIASDSLASSAPTTVTIDVTGGPPISQPDHYSDQAGQKLSIAAASGVLANDTDPNGLTLTAALAEGGGPKHGTLTLSANGAFTYTPDVGFAGIDTFTYIASDSLASGAPTTVSVDVTASSPVAKPETYSAVANETLTVDAALGVLADDTDPNGLALTASLAPGGGPLYGSLTLNANGSFSYILNAGFGGFTGTDSFSYIASDGLASSAPTTVTIDVSDGETTAKVAASAKPTNAVSPASPSAVGAAETVLAVHQFVAAMAGLAATGGSAAQTAGETLHLAQPSLTAPAPRSAFG
jgi:VCBS repeat-containing protein